MDYKEFKETIKKDDPEEPSRVMLPLERAMVVLGPKRADTAHLNMANLDVGICPMCMAMVKEVAPAAKRDFRIVNYVCTENENHRYTRNDMTRTKPSSVQIEAWKDLSL